MEYMQLLQCLNPDLEYTLTQYGSSFVERCLNLSPKLWIKKGTDNWLMVNTQQRRKTVVSYNWPVC